MAATILDVINQSLTLIGADPMVTDTDDTNTGRIVSAHYADTLKALHEARIWSHGVFGVDGDADPGNPFNGFYNYTSPPTGDPELTVIGVYRVLRSGTKIGGPRQARKLYEAINSDNDLEHEVLSIDGVLVVQVKRAAAAHILWRLVDGRPASWSGVFTRCMVTRLAATICIALTKNDARERMLWARYEGALQEAGQFEESQGEYPDESSAIGARYR